MSRSPLSPTVFDSYSVGATLQPDETLLGGSKISVDRIGPASRIAVPLRSQDLRLAVIATFIAKWSSILPIMWEC